MAGGPVLTEISRHYFYYMKESGVITGHVLSTNYKVLIIPAGGLEINI